MHSLRRIPGVLAKTHPTFLLASHDPALLAAIEPTLLASGAHVDVVLSLEAAMDAIAAAEPPTLVLLDTALPAMDPRMNIERLLAAARADEAASRIPIVLISDTVTQNWLDRLAEGVIDDLILHTQAGPADPQYWRLRVETVLRSRQSNRELESLREAQLLNARMDRLTGAYNRETILTMLFRETDRVQRMNTSLSLLLLDIDDFGHWNSRLGNDACDDLLRQVVSRLTRLLRSYDLLGRAGKDEFLLGLPGCSVVNTVMLAERIRVDVFAAPFQVAGESIRLSACFGIASSQGRSPVIVLREAEQALQWARNAGPESIQCFGDCPASSDAPVAFLSPSSGDDLLPW
jgi:two-component system, cell cycle response regulator